MLLTKRINTMEKEVNIIVAFNNKGYIGNKGNLLYHIPEDLKRFKKLTTGGTVIMGRKTFQSLPNGALPNRENIVISKTLKNGAIEGVKIYQDIKDAIKESVNEKVWIIGGAEIYKLAFDENLVDNIEVTKIFEEDEGDVKFPFPKNFDSEWKVTEFEDYPKYEGINYMFFTLIKK